MPIFVTACIAFAVGCWTVNAFVPKEKLAPVIEGVGDFLFAACSQIYLHVRNIRQMLCPMSNVEHYETTLAEGSDSERKFIVYRMANGVGGTSQWFARLLRPGEKKALLQDIHEIATGYRLGSLRRKRSGLFVAIDAETKRPRACPGITMLEGPAGDFRGNGGVSLQVAHELAQLIVYDGDPKHCFDVQSWNYMGVVSWSETDGQTTLAECMVRVDSK